MGLKVGRKARMYRPIWFFSILILTIIFYALPISANPLTVVTLSLQEETPFVDVSPGSTGIVEIQGNATCLKYGPDEVSVSLSASSDVSGASVEPPTMVFTGMSGSEETKPFMVSIRVPQGTSTKATPTATVSGIFTQGGLEYSINPVTTIIEVLPYCNIEMKIPERKMTVNAGDNVVVELQIANMGNCDDIYLIDIINRAKYQNSGFLIPSEMEIPFAEGENKTISWDMGTKTDMSGRYFMEISILSRTSETDGSPISVTTSFEVNVISNTITHQVVSFFLSPLVIIGIILVIVIVYVLRRKIL